MCCVFSCLFFLGAAGRNAYLEVMIKMAEKYKKKMWGSVTVAHFHVDCS